MCGAQIMPYTWREIWERYNYYLHGIKDARPNDIQPHYALRPSMSSPIVRIHDGETEICNARWGVVPSWWKKDKPPGKTFNARRESIEDQLSGKRGMWAPPMKTNRCLVVTGGYFEWTGPRDDKLPWFIHMPDREMFSFAGLAGWNPDYGVSYYIITQPPSDNIEDLHHRMPVVIRPENYSSWLSADTSAEDALSMLDDHDDGKLVFYRVSKDLVNYQKNVPEAIEPIAA